MSAQSTANEVTTWGTRSFSELRLFEKAAFAFWVFFIFVASMAILQHATTTLERIIWLLADAIVVVAFFKYQSQFISLSLNNLVFMIWPVLAIASAAWSVAPGASAYQGAQLLLTTFVAFLICIQYRLKQIVIIMFAAMLGAAIVSLIVSVTQPRIGVDVAGSWRGSFPTKNVMGDAMALLMISASCLFLSGWRRVLTGAALILGLGMIVMTKAATPLLSVIMTLAPLPFGYALLRGRSPFLILLGIAITIGAICVIAFYIGITYFRADPIEAVLAMVGKDRTLTGRTELWDLAIDGFEEKPWLGHGFNAYWVDPPAIVYHIRLATGVGVNFFHHNYLELAVAFGVLGPILLVFTIITGLLRSVRRLAFASDAIALWPLLLTIQVTIQTFVQNPLVANHGLWHVLFIVAAVARR